MEVNQSGVSLEKVWRFVQKASCADKNDVYPRNKMTGMMFTSFFYLFLLLYLKCSRLFWVACMSTGTENFSCAATVGHGRWPPSRGTDQGLAGTGLAVLG